MMAGRHLVGRVTRRADLTPDLWTIRVDPGGPFPFAPGQYATLALSNGEGRIVERAYSIASAPQENELEFFLERVPQGSLTPMLHRLREGAQLLVRRGAKGKFTLDTASGKPNHLLLCTVTGIAPFVSYARALRYAWKRGTFPQGTRLFLIQGGSVSPELGYRGEMEALAREVPWFTYQPTISRSWEDPGWRGETGRVEDVLRKYADAWGLSPQDTIAYLCGNPGMIENGRGILQRRGFLDRTGLRWEAYWVPPRPPPLTASAREVPPAPDEAETAL